MDHLERLRQFRNDRSGTYDTPHPVQVHHQRNLHLGQKRPECAVPKVSITPDESIGTSGTALPVRFQQNPMATVCQKHAVCGKR
jgi:hypothetical protein